jgi:hypothetical protein
MKPDKVAGVLVLSGALLLIITAGLHLFGGYPYVLQALAGSGIKPTNAAVFKAMWVLFSSHLIIVSGVLILCSLRGGRLAGPVIILCGLIPVVDAAVLAWFVGSFVGNKLLAASGMSVLLGGVLLFRRARV